MSSTQLIIVLLTFVGCALASNSTDIKEAGRQISEEDRRAMEMLKSKIFPTLHKSSLITEIDQPSMIEGSVRSIRGWLVNEEHPVDSDYYLKGDEALDRFFNQFDRLIREPCERVEAALSEQVADFDQSNESLDDETTELINLHRIASEISANNATLPALAHDYLDFENSSAGKACVSIRDCYRRFINNIG